MIKIKANEALSPISNLSNKKFNFFLLETLFTKFKILLSKNSQTNVTSYDSADIIAEIEALKKEKEELLTTNTQLSDELKQMEESAAEESG